MQVGQLMRRYLNALSICLPITMCCIILLLSACNTTVASGSASVTPVKPSPTIQLISPKVDESRIDTEAARRAELAKAQGIMANMSLEQKLGQLILVEYLGNSYQGPQGGLQYMVSQQFVGGFMYQYSNHNFDPPYNAAMKVGELSQQAMQDAKIPLLIATDQEGGQVNRLYTFHGPLPSAYDMAATGNPNFAFTQGSQSARWMLQLGINADLAPVVDVGPTSNLLEDRQFSSNPGSVATYAGAFLNGLQENGVVGCLKHFPGLGSLPGGVNYDPHHTLPIVNRSLTAVENIDLAPYKEMIQHDQPAMIMSTDVVTTAIDPNLPAELSPKAITGVLRNQLGYDGVVITDGLYMGGITSRWSLAQAAVLAIIAGNDIIEGPYTPSLVASVVNAFKQALQQGTLTMARVNQAVERILLLKVHFGIIK